MIHQYFIKELEILVFFLIHRGDAPTFALFFQVFEFYFIREASFFVYMKAFQRV